MNRIILDSDKVKAVNEIYHNLEAEFYDKRHPEIYDEERESWEKIGKHIFNKEKSMTLLDIGTGAGFVPIALSRYLKKDDKVICTDLSENMLKVTEKYMAGQNNIKKEFIKADALEVSNMGLKADIVTMNSVLHHIPDYERVLPKLAKLVNSEGYFVIMHERNRLHPENKSVYLAVLRNLSKTKALLRVAAKKILCSIGIYKMLPGPWHDFNRKVCAAINGKNIFDRTLTLEDINAIVDIHDPDEKGDGFDPFDIQKRYFPEFKIAMVDTYKHLGAWIKEDSNFINRYFAKKIKREHPYAGALFYLVMKRQ
jgi:Methylase involved in ubiquinone/menaquinone biosynthesis